MKDDPSQTQLDEIGASPEVRNYIAKHNLLATICDVVRLIRKHFDAITKIVILIDKDPDEEGQWIVIDVITSMTVDAAVGAYKTVVNDWNAKPINNNDFVRLTFTIM